MKNDSSLPMIITRFLNNLGFKVERTEKRTDIKDDKCEVFRAYSTPLERGLKDYEHPVFKYGTDLGDSINVVCLFGWKGASTIIQIIANQLQLNGPTIVLNDGAMTIVERNSLAKEFKSNTSGQNSYLLIDRVLLLFLASLNVGDRMVAMLRCTLPYTFEQLFSTGVGAVSDEMFMGRIFERNAITSDTGPCLVYGGRQLGKTALLRRARNISHHPDEKLFSVYLDIKDKGEDGLVKDLSKELGFIGFDASASGIEEVCDKLRALYESRSFYRLQIFIDEVDHFFDETTKDDYKALDCIMQLMSRTNQKIKFIFAGLHNVARMHSASKSNGRLVQFSKHICIAPLSPKDARKLIERPLSYLGFSIGEHELALILANTNSYPGLLHLFCSSLVQSACENYSRYYSVDKNPPYRLSDEQLKDIFSTGGMEDALAKNVKSTINDLDYRYRVISNLVAHLALKDRASGRNNLYGYSASEILAVMEIPCLTSMEAMDFEVLLSEMTEMGILWSKPGSGLFRLRNEKFLEIIGTPDEIEHCIIEASLK
jgi:predicted AAA+ superfamily ATPase